MGSLTSKQGSFGTAPVFIAFFNWTILFLRFGYAVGNLGFIMTLFIIISLGNYTYRYGGGGNATNQK